MVNWGVPRIPPAGFNLAVIILGAEKINPALSHQSSSLFLWGLVIVGFIVLLVILV